jgi:hypothetical protein
MKIFNEPITTLKEFVRMKYRTIRVWRPLIDARILLNEYEEVIIAFKENPIGSILILI